MQDALTWGAVIAAGGSIIAMIKFWMDLGAALSEASKASATASIAVAKNELLAREFSDYKVESAEKFATFKAMAATEQRLSTSAASSEARLASSVESINATVSRMSDRVDRFIEGTKS